MLKRIEARGTSHRLYSSIKDELRMNHAGKGGTRVPFDKFKAWARGEFKKLDSIEGESWHELDDKSIENY